MGLNADAELVWGIPVLAYDDDYEPTGWWDEDADDWRSFPDTELTIHMYGHYENPDKRGILTSTRIESYSADCWEATPVPWDLANATRNDKLYSKSEDQARSLGLGVSFYTDAGWWLVSSYG